MWMDVPYGLQQVSGVLFRTQYHDSKPKQEGRYPDVCLDDWTEGRMGLTIMSCDLILSHSTQRHLRFVITTVVLSV